MGVFIDFSSDYPVNGPLLYAIIQGLTGEKKIKMIGYNISKKLTKFDYFNNDNYACNTLT